MRAGEPSAKPRLALWLAQGFGVGRIPRAPGTFGSLAGLVWFCLLTAFPNPLIFVGGTIVGIGFSIWVTGIAERALGMKDPGSVVLDEIVAIPACFASWIAIVWFQQGDWPTAAFFFSHNRWVGTLGVVGAFRAFDIFKPWPVRQVQSLHGGYGVVVDDLVAAAYVNLCVVFVFLVKPTWFV